MNKDGRIYVHEEPPEEKEEYIEDKQHKISEKKPKKKERKEIAPEEEEQSEEKVKTKKKIKQPKNAITKDGKQVQIIDDELHKTNKRTK